MFQAEDTLAKSVYLILNICLSWFHHCLFIADSYHYKMDMIIGFKLVFFVFASEGRVWIWSPNAADRLVDPSVCLFHQNQGILL